VKLPLRAVLSTSLLALPFQLAAQSPEDPVTYCKSHADEPKCVEFMGAQSPFYSRSGNVGAAQQSRGAPENSHYVLFLHVGGGPPGSAKSLANTVANALQAQGYVVRGVDDKLDAVGGPGVDYFYDQDRSGAADVADVVNAALLPVHPKKRLEPRFQSVKNPMGFLGVWLY
jgi:hypothetical protein